MRHRYRSTRSILKKMALILLIAAIAISPAAVQARVILKVALLPIFDVLPFYVAEANGYYNAGDIRIEGLPVGSALERDQLLQAGEIDGVLNEMTSVASFNRKQTRVKVVRWARHPAPGHPLFRLISAPGSGISTPQDLTGIPIAVSTNTIIEYVTDRLLRDKGLETDRIVKKSVPVIPERYQLLMQGQINAAMIPDPLAKSALVSGAGEIFNDTENPKYSISVLTFTVGAIDQKAEAIRLFLKGWDRAAADINKNPDAFRDLLLEKIRVPKNIKESYKIPVFPENDVPGPAQWADVLDWMKGKGLIEKDLPYDQSVTRAFLP